MFLNNNYGLLWMLFFLFQLPMSTIAYVLTAVIRKSQTAMYAGFAIFLIGWITQTVVIFGVPFEPSFVDVAGGHITRVFAALPWNLLVKVRRRLHSILLVLEYQHPYYLLSP